MNLTKLSLRTLTVLGLVLSMLALTTVMLKLVQAQEASILIVKEPDQTVVRGSDVTFTIAVTNTGDVTLTGVTVLDPLASSCARPTGDLPVLAPGEGTCYECVQPDVISDLTNLATVTGTDVLSATAVTGADIAVVHVISPAIAVVKVAEPTVVNVGDMVNYTITVENIGDANLADVTVDEDLVGCILSNPSGDDGDLILETDETWRYTCSVLAGDEDIVNTATVSASHQAGGTVIASAQAGVDVIHPTIEIAKIPDTQMVRSNSTVTFTIAITNTGDVTLTDVSVSDPLVGNCDRGYAELAATDSRSYTCALNDVTDDFTNAATVSGVSPLGDVVSDTDTASVHVISPTLEIAKTPAVQTVTSGSSANFVIAITNTSDVTLTNVAVSDAQAPNCDRLFTRLLAGSRRQYSCSVSNVTDGFINSARVTGVPPVGGAIAGVDAAKVRLDQTQTCPASMAAYWNLDETSGASYDDFYYGLDGECADHCPTPVAGRVNGGQEFDGSNTGIDVPAVPGDDSFDWGANDSFSIEFWMKADSAHSCARSNEVVVGRDDSPNSQLHWWVGIGCWMGGKAAFVLRDRDADELGVAVGSTIVTDGSWYHVVAVRDAAAGENLLFVNGVEEAAVDADYSTSTGFGSPTAALNVGWLDLGSHGYHFDGVVDEVAVYDRALSADEIRRHRNEGLAGRWYCQGGTYAPIIVSTPVTQATTGRLYEYDVEAVGDPEPTYALLANPDGMTIDPATGAITWTPTVAQEGAHDVEVQASNAEGAATQNFIIRVTEGTLCPDPMIAYWKLNEDSGSTYQDFYDGHDGVCAGSCPTAAMGSVEGGQEFDGSTTGIDVPADTDFDWGAQDSFSIEFWMKADGANSCSRSNEIIVGRNDKDRPDDGLQWWVGVGCYAGGRAAFILRDEDGITTGEVVGTTVVTDAVWHHVVAVRDADTGRNRLYVDGKEEGSVEANYVSGFDSTTDALNIGWLNRYQGYHFDGIVDEVALYDRALSTEEVEHHYNEGDAYPGYCINPDISINKTASRMVVRSEDVVTYTYTVTNPGDAPLSGVRPADDRCDLVTFVGGDDGDNELNPGEGWVFRCATTLDEDTTNVATVTGTHRFPDGTVVHTDTLFVDVISPGIVIEKVADSTTVDAGDIVTYTYTVTNTGDDPLPDLSVGDDKCGSAEFVGGDENGSYTFDPGEIWMYVCSMELSATTTNIGTATGTDSSGRPVSATDTATVKVKGAACIYLPMVTRSH